MKENSQITLTAEDGSEEAFFVWEKAEIAGREYLLVSEAAPDEDTEEEADAFILRVHGEEEDGEILYDVVEDEKELLIISKYFEELLEDIDIEM